MLDSKYIRENADRIRTAIKHKKIVLDLDELISIDDERRKLTQEAEEIQRSRNEHAAQVEQAGKPTPVMIASGKKIKDSLILLEQKLKSTESKFNELMLLVPNVYSEDTPVGSDESDNKELRKVGTVPSFGFTPKSHEEIGRGLDLIDTVRGVKVAGFRGYY
ncbi:MAG: serine--tRNA ligase, partial [Candidatus Komeilibacteria bacterium]|nr:serine--tRNA ligase [Candidatus Komeilibacteria bacterium]